MATPEDPKVLSTVSFKLKDRPGRQFKVFDLKKQFGFIPETIILGKLKGCYRFVLSAIVPKEKLPKK